MTLQPPQALAARALVVLIAALVLLATGSAAGWLVNGWRWQGKYEAQKAAYAAKDAAAASTVARLQADTRQKEAQAASRVAALDVKYQKEITHAQAENDKLRAAVRAGDVRLRIAVRSAAAASGPAAQTESAGRTDDRTTAELDPAAADWLVGITSEGDDAIRQLTALQGFVRAECGRD
ncbi:lysis system i-spanin subunit Rz [Chitinilyticum aquatile]|uniref:lysis system i-spanin subunit Rz n=1 Tax=Chitinilyticum aquatile TaxID=362520 RepID=UPI00041B9FE7|nr:lysis system i-spanin subunit Rz [Chitinilyticum aquatile]